jgi:hypothetical protein
MSRAAHRAILFARNTTGAGALMAPLSIIVFAFIM